jgi:dienelactone hydrolase
VAREQAGRYAKRGCIVMLNQFHRNAEPKIVERTESELRSGADARGEKIAVLGFRFSGRYAFVVNARRDVQAAARSTAR